MNTLLSTGQGTAVGEGQSFLIMRLWRAGCCALAAVIAIVATAGPAGAQCMYEVTIIRAPLCPGGGVREQPGTVAEDMSETGVVVGWYTQCADFSRKEAFMWSEQSGFETLPRPTGVTSAQALAVSRDGSIIVGQMIKQSGPEPRTVGFVLLTGQMVNLGALPGHQWSYAFGVSNSGEIVGQSQDVFVGPINAVRWVNQTIQTLPSGNNKNSGARAINNNNQIVGHVGQLGWDSIPVVWDQLVLQMLETGYKISSASAKSVNDNDGIGGSLSIIDKKPGTDPSSPMVWHNPVPELLPFFPDTVSSAVSDLNDARQPVGACRQQTAVPLGTIWIDSEAFVLNDLIIANPQILLVERAEAISNDGRIIATIRTLISGTSGVVTGLLTPVDSAPSDLNHDCLTDIFDLFLLLGEWNKEDSFADIDDSGNVDVFDLFVLLDGWG